MADHANRGHFGNPGYPGDVPVGPILEACQRAIAEGSDWSKISRALGYLRTDKRRGFTYADTSRLKRNLGLMSNIKTHKGVQRKVPVINMRYETAINIIQALNLDPVDFDL